MQFKKDHISHLKGAIDESLSSHFKQYLNSIDLDNEDLSIKVDYKSGNPSSLKFNVEIYLDEPQSQLDLKSMLSYMPNIDVEKIVDYRGMVLKLVDYKRANRKYPFILEDLKTSKRYKFTMDQFQSMMTKEKVAS